MSCVHSTLKGCAVFLWDWSLLEPINKAKSELPYLCRSVQFVCRAWFHPCDSPGQVLELCFIFFAQHLTLLRMLPERRGAAKWLGKILQMRLAHAPVCVCLHPSHSLSLAGVF